MAVSRKIGVNYERVCRARLASRVYTLYVCTYVRVRAARALSPALRRFDDAPGGRTAPRRAMTPRVIFANRISDNQQERGKRRGRNNYDFLRFFEQSAYNSVLK